MHGGRLVLVADETELYNPNVIRSSVGVQPIPIAMAIGVFPFFKKEIPVWCAA